MERESGPKIRKPFRRNGGTRRNLNGERDVRVNSQKYKLINKTNLQGKQFLSELKLNERVVII